LRTGNEDEANQIVLAKNQAERQPVLNLQIAKAYPERFAQMALGHNSKAVHRAYAKKAQVTLPPLEEYEWRIWSGRTSEPRNFRTTELRNQDSGAF
jgi:hypothetical protein